jgi:hypothetical protein
MDFFLINPISHMLHGAGIFTYTWVIFGVNVGKYSSTMEHLGIASSFEGHEKGLDLVASGPGRTSL